MFSIDQINLTKKIAILSEELNVMISTAESCTGGLVGSCLTNISGSGNWIGAIRYYLVRKKTGTYSNYYNQGPGADEYDVLNGYVKSFNIWSKALNQDDVTLYYNLGRNFNVYNVLFDLDCLRFFNVSSCKLFSSVVNSFI